MKFSKAQRLLRQLTWRYRSAKFEIQRPNYTPYEVAYPYQIIKWSPNTCDCIILQSFNRNHYYPKHGIYTFHSYENRCKKHKHLFGMRLFDAVRRENHLVNISHNNSRTAPKSKHENPYQSLVVKQAQLYMQVVNSYPDYIPSIDELIDEEVQNHRPVKLVNYSGNK